MVSVNLVIIGLNYFIFYPQNVFNKSFQMKKSSLKIRFMNDNAHNMPKCPTVGKMINQLMYIHINNSEKFY